ncbi:MAG: thrombospondin type 3 repeat-containing protein [Patescibacteria group bacterium]|nr:thrombospondin type 3 repeat-containing protein [Patescibacteria group bacterium]MDD5121423.1 thrombospondin type 3 repeat-containing protein [Patescibacteria group bacterium]MDD5221891.1 thrombospondin type 3 repeat-containing protein [Patescibacteria group bacterium]MDD5395658.1 thrombospondin type 3 repeat-containing protein [Patescibacteria group bacterium]
MFANESNLNQEPEDIFASGESNKSVAAVPGKTDPLSRTVKRQGSPRQATKFLKIILIIIIIALVGYGGYYAYGKFGPIIKSKLAEVKSTKPTPVQEVVNNKINNDTSQPSTILDSDKDGLSDQEEQSLATDPNKADSDNDGLLDNEEVKIYKSNPLSGDSNNDGISDGDSVRRGIDPVTGAQFDLQKAINNF